MTEGERCMIQIEIGLPCFSINIYISKCYFAPFFFPILEFVRVRVRVIDRVRVKVR